MPEVDPAEVLGAAAVREDALTLPEVSEVEVMRHFTRLSTWNAAVDFGLYPLGSCTMKYNPRVNERVAALPGFAQAHPLQPPALSQGFLELAWRLERGLAGRDVLARVEGERAQGPLSDVQQSLDGTERPVRLAAGLEVRADDFVAERVWERVGEHTGAPA